MLQLFDSIIEKNYSTFSFIVSIGVEFKNYKIIRIVMENDCEYNYKLIVSGYEKGRYEKLKVHENIFSSNDFVKLKFDELEICRKDDIRMQVLIEFINI
jgi:hypothetical protein